MQANQCEIDELRISLNTARKTVRSYGKLAEAIPRRMSVERSPYLLPLRTTKAITHIHACSFSLLVLLSVERTSFWLFQCFTLGTTTSWGRLDSVIVMSRVRHRMHVSPLDGHRIGRDEKPVTVELLLSFEF